MLSNINKWDGSKIVNRPDAFIPGDTLSDLRTSDNTLSVWKADTEEDVEDALVALALNRDSVGKLSYCLLDETELKNIEINVSDDIPGTAPGLDEEILKKHRDLIDLDYWRIGYLAEMLLNKLQDKKNQKFLTKRETETLLKKYRDNDKIDMNKMKDKLLKNLGWM